MPQGTPQSAAFFMTFGKPQSAGDPMPNAFCLNYGMPAH